MHISMRFFQNKNKYKGVVIISKIVNYIGIDPGKNGGISFITEVDGEIKSSYSEVYSDENIINLIRKLSNVTENNKCVLEHLHAMPGQGVTSMFNFGANFGFIQGVLKSFGVPYELVTPQKWKKEFSVTGDKNSSSEVARRLFPSVDFRASDRCKKDHDGKTESMLMAEYARRKMQ